LQHQVLETGRRASRLRRGLRRTRVAASRGGTRVCWQAQRISQGSTVLHTWYNTRPLGASLGCAWTTWFAPWDAPGPPGSPVIYPAPKKEPLADKKEPRTNHGRWLGRRVAVETTSLTGSELGPSAYGRMSPRARHLWQPPPTLDLGGRGYGRHHFQSRGNRDPLGPLSQDTLLSPLRIGVLSPPKKNAITVTELLCPPW